MLRLLILTALICSAIANPIPSTDETIDKNTPIETEPQVSIEDPEKAEQELKGCQRNGVVYTNGQTVKYSRDPCQSCLCNNGEIICDRITCIMPKRSGCTPMYRMATCCPMYKCPDEVPAELETFGAPADEINTHTLNEETLAEKSEFEVTTSISKIEEDIPIESSINEVRSTLDVKDIPKDSGEITATTTETSSLSSDNMNDPESNDLSDDSQFWNSIVTADESKLTAEITQRFEETTAAPQKEEQTGAPVFRSEKIQIGSATEPAPEFEATTGFKIATGRSEPFETGNELFRNNFEEVKEQKESEDKIEITTQIFADKQIFNENEATNIEKLTPAASEIQESIIQPEEDIKNDEQFIGEFSNGESTDSKLNDQITKEEVIETSVNSSPNAELEADKITGPEINIAIEPENLQDVSKLEATFPENIAAAEPEPEPEPEPSFNQKDEIQRAEGIIAEAKADTPAIEPDMMGTASASKQNIPKEILSSIHEKEDAKSELDVEVEVTDTNEKIYTQNGNTQAALKEPNIVNPTAELEIAAQSDPEILPNADSSISNVEEHIPLASNIEIEDPLTKNENHKFTEKITNEVFNNQESEFVHSEGDSPIVEEIETFDSKIPLVAPVHTPIEKIAAPEDEKFIDESVAEQPEANPELIAIETEHNPMLKSQTEGHGSPESSRQEISESEPIETIAKLAIPDEISESEPLETIENIVILDDISESRPSAAIERIAIPAENFKSEPVQTSGNIAIPDEISKSEPIAPIEKIEIPDEISQTKPIETIEKIDIPADIFKSEQIETSDNIAIPGEISESKPKATIEKIAIPDKTFKPKPIETIENIAITDEKFQPKPIETIEKIDNPKEIFKSEQIETSENIAIPHEISESEPMATIEKIAIPDEISQPKPIETIEKTATPDEIFQPKPIETSENIAIRGEISESNPEIQQKVSFTEQINSKDDTQTNVKDGNHIGGEKLNVPQAFPIPVNTFRRRRQRIPIRMTRFSPKPYRKTFPKYNPIMKKRNFVVMPLEGTSQLTRRSFENIFEQRRKFFNSRRRFGPLKH